MVFRYVLSRTLASGVLLVLAGLHGVSLPGEKKEQKSLVVNINTATMEELRELPGIGKALAGRIIRHREKHGRFRKVEELLVIRGISRKKFDTLRPHVTIGDAKETKDAQEAEEERQ